MPEPHPLTEVELLLDANRPIAPGLYILYLKNHFISLSRPHALTPPYAHITTLTSGQINSGLSSNLWNQIEAKIRTLTKELNP